MSPMDRRTLAYEAYFFDLGGTLVAIENDEIYRAGGMDVKGGGRSG